MYILTGACCWEGCLCAVCIAARGLRRGRREKVAEALSGSRRAPGRAHRRVVGAPISFPVSERVRYHRDPVTVSPCHSHESRSPGPAQLTAWRIDAVVVDVVDALGHWLSD